MPVVRRTPALIACALALALAGPAGASVQEVGQPSDAAFPAASCPDNCQAIGGMTGFQVQIGAHKNPYVITQPGKIVALTLRLGKPNANQQQDFTNPFGGPPRRRPNATRRRPSPTLLGGQPQARVTILQQVRSTHAHRVPRWTYQVVA